MKKQIVIAAILGLAALAACGQTANLTAPKSGEPWALNTSQTITWTWSGSAQIKLVLVRQNGSKLGIIKSGLQLSAGGYIWKVGTLENGTSVPAASDYMIRLITLDSKTLQTGPAFSITAPGQPPSLVTVVPFTGFIIPPMDTSIKITKPGKGAVWIPLKNYTVKWSWNTPMDQSGCGHHTNCSGGCLVDVWLVPAAQSAAGPKIPLAKQLCCPSRVSKGVVTYSGEHSGIVPNQESGKYVVRVSYADNPTIYGDSQAFTIQSTMSTDTAFLDPDQPQHVDLALTNVLFDNGVISMWIKNLGGFFSEKVTVKYEISHIGNSAKIVKKGEDTHQFTAKGGEEQKLLLTGWGGFTFSDFSSDIGKYIPVASRPISLKVQLSANFDVNVANNQISKEMCMISAPDIGTDGEVNLIFSPKERLYITRGTANTIHEAKIKWLSQDTFEAELEVDLWNYGAKTKTFDCWLYADQLPGQIVAKGITLQPGYKMTWKQPVKIKLQSRCGAHKLVFIADPNEHKDEPYPNSYQNNFIHVILNILCAGAIQGAG